MVVSGTRAVPLGAASGAILVADPRALGKALVPFPRRVNLSAPYRPRALARDPWILAALAAALIYQLAVTLASRGARNGDAVEHLERAADLARGLELGADATRGPLLSLLLALQRQALDAIGFAGAPALELATRAGALACSALALLAAAALARACAGRGAARAAAWIAASSPIWAAWGGEPTSAPFATAALLCGARDVALARTASAAARGGALLGLAVALKYQLVFLAPFLLFLPALAPAAPHARRTCAALGCAASALLLCAAADALAYGAPLATAGAYLRANALPPLYALLHPFLPTDARLALHGLLFDVEAGPAVREGLPLARRKPLFWYGAELPNGWPLPWLALALASLAPGRRAPETPEREREARARLAWRAARVLGAAVALHVAALSLKGEKELRLLFPLVPLVACVASAPVAALWCGLRSRAARAATCACAVVGAAWPALALLGALPGSELRELERHWAYAAAMRELGARAARGEEPAERVAALFHFAIALEERSELGAERAPFPLDRVERAPAEGRRELEAFFAPRGRVLFRAPEGSAASAWERADAAAARVGLEAIAPQLARGADGFPAWERACPPERCGALGAALRATGAAVLESGDARPDWLLGHAQGFHDQPALLRLLAADYRLAGAFDDRARKSALGELWVLARADRAPGEWPLARRHASTSRAALREELTHPLELLFVDAERREALELLGVEVHPRFARDGFALGRWIWRARRGLAAEEIPRAARRATLGGGARQIDAPIGGGLFAGAPWDAGELREELALLPLRGLGDPGRAHGFELWVALFDSRGERLAPQDRGRYARSIDGFVRVGGGICERLSDRSLPVPNGG